MKATTVASTVIALLWLTGSGTAFWWFSLRHQSNFAENYVYFNGEQLAGTNLNANPIGPTLLHIIDTNCPCSRFALPHIMQLQAQFNQSALHYVWPNMPPSLTELPAFFKIDVAFACTSASFGALPRSPKVFYQG